MPWDANEPAATVGETAPLSVLLVSYAFPPTGGVGVQRVSKLVKYLPQFGIEPAVLTVHNPSVPLQDDSAAADLPEHLRVLRAATLEPGYRVKEAAWQASAERRRTTSLSAKLKREVLAFSKRLLLPDPQVLWQPAAQWALARLLWSNPPDVILISGPPFSQFLLGPLVRASGRSVLVFDYRDEWSTYAGQYEMMAASNIAAKLEKHLILQAHVVTTATEAFREELLRRFPRLNPARVVSITNGYDRDDLPLPLPAPPRDRFVATYAGTVLRMTRPKGLLEGLSLLRERSPNLAKLLEVRFIGRIVPTENELFEGSERLGIKRLGFASRRDVLSDLAKSHLNLCILDEVPGNERVCSGKIYELMAIGRPVLTLAPRGALTQLVEQHNLGPALPPRDAPAIAAELERRLRQFKDGSYSPHQEPIGIEQYDRRQLARRFATVFREATKQAR